MLGCASEWLSLHSETLRPSKIYHVLLDAASDPMWLTVVSREEAINGVRLAVPVGVLQELSSAVPPLLYFRAQWKGTVGTSQALRTKLFSTARVFDLQQAQRKQQGFSPIVGKPYKDADVHQVLKEMEEEDDQAKKDGKAGASGIAMSSSGIAGAANNFLNFERLTALALGLAVYNARYPERPLTEKAKGRYSVVEGFRKAASYHVCWHSTATKSVCATGL